MKKTMKRFLVLLCVATMVVGEVPANIVFASQQMEQIAENKDVDTAIEASAPEESAPETSEKTNLEGTDVEVSEGTGSEVSEGTGSEVSEGTGSEVSEGTGSEVSEGTESEVSEGTESEVSEGTESEVSEGIDVEVSEGTDVEVSEETDAEVLEGTESEVSEETDAEVLEEVETEILVEEPESTLVNMITVDAATTTEATLCGDALTWSYDKDTAVLTVSGNGDMYDYAKEKAPWYSSRKAIKEIHIGKDVTSIGNYAFYNLIAVETVVFGEVVTDDESVSGNDPSVSENDPSVSENDPSVSDNNPSVSENNLTVSDNNASETDNETTLTQKDVYESSLKKIGRNAFHSMKKLKTIQLPDSVESLGYQCFASCTNLQYVTLSKNWKECPTHTEGKSGIDYQGRIFEESNMIVDVICPEGMTIVPAYAFAKTWTMTEVRLPETVTEIGAYAYYDCENLARIDFPDTVETIGNNAFAECIDLRVIDMSESMETIPKDAFKGDTALTAVFFKDAIKNIDAGAFNGCKNVENLYYTGTKAQWEEVSVGANNTILDNAVWEYESVAGFVRPTYIREKSYTQPATNLPASFYGGRKKGNMITLTEEEFENAFFGPDSDMYGVSIPKDCYITFGFDKAYKCRKRLP